MARREHRTQFPSQYADPDAAETAEWIAALDAVIDTAGPNRARFLVQEVLRRASERDLGVPDVRHTDYINTIPPTDEPPFPGDEDLERRIRSLVRWNAAIMVHRAQRPGIEVGGHISSYASSASLYEVGLNHFFRGQDHPSGGDQIFWQGHASPGAYARAFLEGRLSAERLDGFRQQVSRPGGLPSYPHPRLMPDFWRFPTVSMGLGPLAAIYQARMNRYLSARGIRDTSGQHVWAFLGDGEMDEPESSGALWLASRETLDNLTFVVNCNLQRLDGPVRGNGKIIQELESLFRGAGWNVIKVVWGRDWDHLLESDASGALVALMNATPDGDYQTYKSESGAFVREHFFGRDPRTAALVAEMTDDQIWRLRRGGHDYRKVHAAYHAALECKGRPTVILAKTIKGWRLGAHFEARNSTHQMKTLTLDDLRDFRDRLGIEIPDSELDAELPPYYHPGPDDPAVEYMIARRTALGGPLPRRVDRSRPLTLPGDAPYVGVRRGSRKQPVATTMSFVRLLKELIKDPRIGPRIVPIVPDEARTFGMDAMFPTQRIYNPAGQHYLSVDRELFLSYQESPTGQILHEGITEAGATASFTAAATSYATQGEPLIPVYLFYSMFGFQRTGDQFWAAMDQLARGFLIGATAGRTTLNGEGLQHQDGHSMLLASTNPGVVAYDPCYGYEIAHIVRHGLDRMYGPSPENVVYYLTLYNEPYVQPPEPDGVDVEGIARGLHPISVPSPGAQASSVRLLASGPAIRWAIDAQVLLADEWGVSAEVWSATSWNELRRDGIACDRHNLLHPEDEPRQPFVSQRLGGSAAPVIAVSDFMRAVPDQIRQWVPGRFVSLGTDGWGLSDTRAALRRYFLVDAQSITVQALSALARDGVVDRDVPARAAAQYGLADHAGFAYCPLE